MDLVVARIPLACHSLPLQAVQRHLTGGGTDVYRENDVSGGDLSLGDARCSAASGCPGARGAGVLRLVLGLHFRLVRRVGVLVLGSAERVVVRPTRGREGSTDYHVELASHFPESVVRLAPLGFGSAGV